MASPAPTAVTEESLNLVSELSELLDVGLDRQALKSLMELSELGVQPEALAVIVCELKREAKKSEEIREG